MKENSGALFAAGRFSGCFNLLLGGFFLLFQARVLSSFLILGLIFAPLVLDYAVVFLHGKTTTAAAGRSWGAMAIFRGLPNAARISPAY